MIFGNFQWNRRLCQAVTIVILLTAGAARAAESYRFGVVPQFEPRKQFAIWAPILREIGRRAGISLKLVGSPKIPDFEKSFLSGAFDFAYMNPYHAMLALWTQGYLPLVRDGGRELVGIVVVGNGSKIADIGDLAGKAVAFPAPNALGASLVVRAALARRNVRGVSRLFVQTHSSVYLHVALGLAAAGGGVMATFRRQPADIRARLRVIWRSRPLPPHPVMAHPRVSAALREKVRQAFLMLGDSEAGRTMLAGIPMKKIIRATRADYTALAGLGLDRFYQAGK